MNKPYVEYDPYARGKYETPEWERRRITIPSALSAKMYSDAICKLCLPGAD